MYKGGCEHYEMLCSHLGSPCYPICEERQESEGGAVWSTSAHQLQSVQFLIWFRSPHITWNKPTCLDHVCNPTQVGEFWTETLLQLALRTCDNNARQLAFWQFWQYCNLTEATFKIALHFSKKYIPTTTNHHYHPPKVNRIFFFLFLWPELVHR